MCVHVCGVHAPPFPSLPVPDTSKLYGCDGDEVMLLRVWLIVVDQLRKVTKKKKNEVKNASPPAPLVTPGGQRSLRYGSSRSPHLSAWLTEQLRPENLVKVLEVLAASSTFRSLVPGSVFLRLLANRRVVS